jgi:hypothetical protein
MASKIFHTSETIEGFNMNSLEFLLVGIWVGMGLGYLITKDFYKKNVDN